MTSVKVVLAATLAVSATGQVRSSRDQQYCNEQYTYCVNVPSVGDVERHEGDAPNHGITIRLSDPNARAWTYAHWDAALLGSSQKAAVGRLETLLEDHPKADASIAPTMLEDLTAYRIRLSYNDNGQMAEELIIAYHPPRDKTQGPGVLYEIGLSCPKDNYPRDSKILQTLVETFRRTGE